MMKLNPTFLPSKAVGVALRGSVGADDNLARDPLVHAELHPLVFGQASRFQIIKTHVARTAVTDDKESIEEMELAATNSNSLEAWLSAIEVCRFGLMDDSGRELALGYLGRDHSCSKAFHNDGA